MRRLSLVVLVFLAVVPAALAARKAVGDGVLELQSVSGVVTIGTVTPWNPARGAVWGQLDSGTLVVLDPYSKDGSLFVSGWDKKPVIKDTPDGKLSIYRGDQLRFRVTGGAYRLVVNGTGLDLTAVGVGVAYLNGDITALDPGTYAVDDSKWQPVPTFLSTKTLGLRVPFGTQPQPPSTQPSQP